MELNIAIKTVSEKFVYTSDRSDSFIKDYWFIMDEKDGKYLGDCEDFSLTVMYLISGNLLTLLWNLLTGKFQLHLVDSKGSGNDHCVGSIDNVWFDNWTMEAKSKDQFFEQTKHIYGKRISFLVIVSKLIAGKLFGKK